MSFGPTAFAMLLCLLVGQRPAPSSLPDSVLPCVPCHNRGSSAQVGEWLASPYSETEGGRGCTDCHGRYCAGTADTRAPGDEGVTRPLRNLSDAVRLTVTAICSDGAVKIEVAVSNVGVGHLLPTGSEQRTLTLEVVARDRKRTPLSTSFVVLQPRLPPFATAVSRYRFAAPESGPVHVAARLVLTQATGPPLEITGSEAVCGSSQEPQ